MITLEEQIRRYAVDVAGPAVAEPPADLAVVGRPRHRGHWVLVAALALFVAGLTWMATRPSELGDRPSVDTVPLPSLTSWAGQPGACTYELGGVQVAGPDAIGLCVGSREEAPDITLVTLVVDGVEKMSAKMTECERVDADWSLDAGGVPFDDRSAWIWWTSDEVHTLVFGLPDGEHVAAATFEVPGLEGHRVSAIWLPPGGEDNVTQLTKDGQIFKPVGEPLPRPDWCHGNAPPS